MQKTSPKDFFLNLGSIILLYIGAGNLLNLIFYIIDKVYPDQALDYYSYSYEMSGARWAIASLMIIYPLYLYILRIINNDTELYPEKRELGIRRWLTYLTLFIAGGIISVDLIVSLNAFLGGELTARFLSKVVSVFAVMILIFKYYISDLKGEQKSGKRIFWLSNLLVLVTVSFGFYIMGSPATQRMKQLDDARVQDLQTIQWQIINFWQQKEKMPNNLSELNDSISGFITPVDPETKSEYKYENASSTSFKLCAKFNLNNKKEIIPKSDINNNWVHDSGEYCFERNIDKELYPPTPKGIRNI